MTTRTYGLLGILVMLTLVFAFTVNAQEGTPKPRIIDLRTPNQIATSVGGVVLPKPELDILESPGSDEGPGWDQIRFTRLQKLANGLLEKIHFDFDSSTVDEEGRMIAEQLAKLLLQNQDVGMLLAGHTDLMGSEEYNQALSERRAAAVKALLMELSVPEARLRTAAFGKKRPEVNEVRKERLNRRCEGVLFLAVQPVQF